MVRGPEWWEQIGKFLNVGAVFDSLRCADVPNFSLKVPPLHEQEAIVRILGPLDRKIELNRKMNETLEAMARALFKSWFVDFDPVRAKAEGRPTGLPAPIAALFPDSFEDSELGEIPCGWKVQKLGSVCEAIFSGGTPSTTNARYWGGNVPWFSSGETRDKFIIVTEKAITQEGVENSSTRFARAGATVIASAGQGNTRGQTSMLLIDTYINQSVVALCAKKEYLTDAFLFFNLERRYDEFRRVSDGHSSRGSLTTKLLGGLELLLPPLEVVQAFEKCAAQVVTIAGNARRQSQTLSATRDALLPKLISGEIRLGATSAKQPIVASIATKAKTTQASDQFKEAILIAALVRSASTLQYPLGNFRRTKFSYVVHRKAAHDVQKQYLKKAAGPYDPKSKYAGPVKIAIQNGYVKKASSGKSEGLVSGDKVELIDEYLPRYEFADAIDWVLQKFKFSKNDDLELFTTVDLAALEIKGRGDAISVDAIIGVIEDDAEWKAKLNRALFSPENIQRALQTMAIHFPETYQ